MDQPKPPKTGWNGYGGINYPLRGHKTTMWEGGIKGIGWLVAPGLLQPGSRYRNLLHVSRSPGSIRARAPRATENSRLWPQGIGGKLPIPAPQCGLHGATHWLRIGGPMPSLFPPSVARGGR